MAAPTKTPNSKEEQDSAYNPGDLHAAEQFGSGYSSAGTDQAEAFANDPANAAKQQEENPDSFNYTGSGSGGTKNRTSFKAQLKKKGPLGALVALLFGGIGGIMIFIAPGLAVVHMSEVLTDDLNDQLGAMDIRTTHVFKAKLKTLGKTGSVCAGGVKVRCGFKGMSNRQVKNFKKAGIKVETDGKTKFGKNKISKMTFTKADGTAGVATTPRDFSKLLGDRLVRNSLRRAFNPKFAGFSDLVSFKVFGRLKTGKANKITGDTDEKKDKGLNKAVEGERGQLDPRTQTISDDDTKEQADQKRKANTSAKAAASGYNAKDGVGTKSIFTSVEKNGIKGAGKGLLITGAADAACTVKNTSRAVESTAKVIRAAQLARFAMVFLTFASSVKAGDATADQAEYVGNKLTAVDTQKEVVNENSTISGDGNSVSKVKNPAYGKNALDSDGFKVAAYNEAPTLSARSLEYTVGGGALMGTLSKVNGFIQQKLGGKKCGVIQNNFVRLGSLAIGIGTGLVSLGTSFVVIGGASVAISMALPILQNYLAKIISGTVVDDKTDGVDAGDAIFAGTAKLQGDIAMNRGMEPQSKSEFKNYLAVSNNIKDEYVAMETKDAKSTPFDVYNQYSFLGSLTRKFLPLETSSVSTAGALSTSLSFIGSTLGNTIPHVKADRVFNEDRFSKCSDTGYEELGIDADVFCNVRYGLSEKELAMDTDKVIDYMYPKYVDDVGVPKGDYKDWLEECVNRTAGWGETPEGEENGGNGKKCKNDSFQLSNFRVYTMDKSIYEAMDYIEPTGGVGFKIGTYNILGQGAAEANGNGGDISWQDRADNVVTTIRDKKFDVLGVQEMTREQFNHIKPQISDTYASYPKKADGGSGYQRSIWWKSSEFTLTKKGIYKLSRYGRSDAVPWVQLTNNSTNQSMYVFNYHNDAGAGAKPAKAREKSTHQLLAAVNKNSDENSTIYALGDFNSANKLRKGSDAGISTKQLPYNVMRNAGFVDAEDTATTKVNAEYDTSHSNVGDQEKHGSHIDHIFIKGQVNVTKWENIINDTTRLSSDHTPLIVNVLLPTTADAAPGSIGGADDYRCTPLSMKYGYCKQCTDFVTFRLQQLTGSKKYQNNNGNGKDYARNIAKKYGFKLNNTPAAGSVVSFRAGQFGMNSTAGHVAIVKTVKADGSIVIEDYNRIPKAYGTLTLPKSKASQLQYAHSEVAYK